MVGITPAPRPIVVLLVFGEGGDDAGVGEPGVQGVDDGAVGPVRGWVFRGVAGAGLYAVDDRQRVAAGRATEPLAGIAWTVGGGAER